MTPLFHGVQVFHALEPAGWKRYCTSKTRPASARVVQMTEKPVVALPLAGVMTTRSQTSLGTLPVSVKTTRIAL